MSIKAGDGAVIVWRDIRLDEVDSGLPRLTIVRPKHGSEHAFRLAPDAVRAIVDALVGVAEPAPGEVRIVVKMAVGDLVAALQGVSGPLVRVGS